jgi:hypothetical protein
VALVQSRVRAGETDPLELIGHRYTFRGFHGKSAMTAANVRTRGTRLLQQELIVCESWHETLAQMFFLLLSGRILFHLFIYMKILPYK